MVAELTEQGLRKQAEKGELQGIYLLYGEEKYLLSKGAARVMEKTGGEMSDFNLQKLDGSSVTVEQIAAAVEALPLLASQKCVAVSDFNVETRPAAEVEKLVSLLGQVPDTTVLLLFFPTLEVDGKRSAKWKRFIQSVQAAGTSVYFPRKTPAELEKLLVSAAEKRRCTLSRSDAKYMVEQCGTDLRTLYHELEKICAFVGEGTVSRQQLEQVLTKNLEAAVFQLAKDLMAGAYEKAYNTLDRLLAQDEDPIFILAALSTVYVDLYRVRVLMQSGRPVAEAAKYFDYKGKEFRLRSAERDSNRFSDRVLRDSLDAIMQTDLALKSTRANNRFLLEELIARLLLLAEKEGNDHDPDSGSDFGRRQIR